MTIFNSLQDPLALIWLEKSSDLGDLIAKRLLADIYFDSEQKEKAKLLYLTLAEASDLHSIEKLAILSYDESDTNGAEVWWTKAVDLGSFFALESLGRFYSGQHKIDQAVEWFTRASESEFVFPKENTDPKEAYWYDTGTPYNQLGKLFMRVGDFQSAVNWFKKDLEYDQSANVFIGECYIELNDLHNAENFFSEALNAGYVEGKAGIGDIRILQNHLDEAQLIFEDLLYYDAFCGLKLARILLEVEEKSEAFDLATYSISNINTAIYHHFSDPKQYHIDDVAWKAEKVVRAVTDFESKVENKGLRNLPFIVNETTNAISNLGIFYFRHNVFNRAEENLLRALHREDRFAEAEASYFLAELYESRGKIKESRRYKERCEKAGGYTPDWDKT